MITQATQFVRRGTRGNATVWGIFAGVVIVALLLVGGLITFQVLEWRYYDESPSVWVQGQRRGVTGVDVPPPLAPGPETSAPAPASEAAPAPAQPGSPAASPAASETPAPGQSATEAAPAAPTTPAAPEQQPSAPAEEPAAAPAEKPAAEPGA